MIKANKAPEKIYLTKNLLGELRDDWNALPSDVLTNIEYTRTDAFIEKACEWLKKWDAYRVCLEGHKDWFIEQFKKAMEE